jgi:flagellin
MLETAEGATLEIANILQRMRELSVQSASGTYSNTDRAALDLEFGELFLEMVRIATQTTWNTMSVLDGEPPAGANPNLSDSLVTSVNIQLGKSTAQTMALSLKTFDPRATFTEDAVMANLVGPVALVNASNINENFGVGAIGGNGNAAGATRGTSAFGAAILYVGNATVWNNAANSRINIQNTDNAGFALTNLDTAITAISSERAKYGAYISRLQHAGDNLLNVAQNQDQSRSRIEDADYAIETSELARTQIIAQASTAMLAQANQAKQTVLTLLK